MEVVVLLVMALGLVLIGLGTVKDDAGTRPFFSANGVVLTMFVLYGLISGLVPLLNGGTYFWAVGFEQDSGYLNALLVFTLAVFTYWVSYVIVGGRARRPLDQASRGVLEDVRPESDDGVAWAIWSLIAIGVAIKLAVVATSGGFSTVVAGASGGAREALGIETVSSGVVAARSISTVADAAATWLLVRSLRTKEQRRLAVIVFVVVVAFSLAMLGKRLTLLWPLLAAGVAFAAYVRSVRMSKAPVLIAGAVLLGMLTLMFRIFAPAKVAGIRINLENVPYARGSVTKFYFNSLEFSAVEMLSLSMQSSEAILGRFDSRFSAFWRTVLEPAFFAIPRAVWPGKPTSFTDMAYAVSGVLTGRPLDEAVVGYAVTYVGVAFILGGLTGVVVSSVALGWFAAALDRRRSRILRTDAGVVWFALALVLLFHAFRHGSIGSAIIIGVVQNYGFVAASIGLTLLARAMSNSRGKSRV